MKSWTRNAALGAGVVALAAALLAVGAAAGSPRDVEQSPAAAAPAGQVGQVAQLQARLKAVPQDDRAWAALGVAYVQQARTTADPTYYPKAQGAFAQSLELMPKDNAAALTGLAVLAAARHDFPGALATVNKALAINDYDATAYGVKTDALTELGRYDEAVKASQRMLDLRPGTDSFSRASYQRELRGDVAGARAAMQRAADDAFAPADKAFALYYLGELAWNNGDRKTARTSYDAALAADQAYLPAVTGQAKALAAAGDPTAALALYREAVQTQPQPAYLVELGELLEATGQTSAAREQYDVVRATQQLFAASGANVDLELALFEADHGSAAKALDYATAAYRTRPDSVLVQDAYAWALHKAGRSREALPIARRAQRLGTRLPYLRYHLGVIEAATGDTAGARRDLTAALALNPSFNPLQAPAARAQLKTLG
ncbi:MAG: tetratricopeptide repeat protein [Actinobacteria bacterium]|nr:tetratricopeptide repeat protein [Actinomycetota bacterium]MCA1719673.1 tetratricopeptide repeat protein [Actinomycetota bacterium]